MLAIVRQLVRLVEQVVAVETNGREQKGPWLKRARKAEWVVKDKFVTVRSTDAQGRVTTNRTRTETQTDLK